MKSTAEVLSRNRLPLIQVRGMVVLVIVPVIVVAIKSPSILEIFFISNLAASAVVPSVFLGLSRKLYFIQGIEVVCGSLGGICGIWVFGLIFYDDDAKAAAKLTTLYTPD